MAVVLMLASEHSVATPTGGAVPAPLQNRSSVDRDIRALAPTGLEVTNVQVSGKSVSVTGTADATARVSAFLKALDASGLFSSVALSLIQSAGTQAPGSTSFTLALTLA